MGQLRAVPAHPLRAIRYARQSTAKEETISDAIQIAACDDHIARCGYIAVGPPPGDPNGPIQLGGVPLWEQHTGRVWHKRAGVQRAIKAIEDGDADVIVMWKWNRLSRRRKHWFLAEVRVEDIGGKIESATEPADLTTSHGRFSRAMMIDLGELQSDLIGDSWRETHDERRRRGLPATGGKRLGYTQVRAKGQPEVYKPNDEAEIMEWAYETYCDGTGFAALVADLNRRGIVNSRGNPFSEQTLARMLDSGFAAGLLIRTEYSPNGKAINLPLHQCRWDKGAHNAIISETLWERYKRERLLRRKESSRSIDPSHELTGLVRCGDEGCRDEDGGSPMVVHSPEQLICSRYKTMRIGKCVTIHLSRVQQKVKDHLRTVADEVTEAANQAANVDVAKLRSRTNAELIAREVIAIDQQLDTATRQVVSGLLPEASYQRVRDELVAEREKANERLAIAERELEQQSGAPAALVAKDLLEEWDTLPVVRRREMLRKLINRVVVVPSGVKGKRNTIILEPK